MNREYLVVSAVWKLLSVLDSSIEEKVSVSYFTVTNERLQHAM
jgi:hypothetical protein